ncbi:MAG: 16S rRNA (guanine(527)-N(7))-methyltransferase RsmG [Rhodospirillaceae bacterium]|nr:16S rRNA (guanine(527)-N(7))-methyltransferase RsmG [Rhodospirillaceae bacterium]|tara:strand:- start:12901 stop:13557 length:657 start_codon:yes stop_codon:yes gene_type:complete
MNKKLVNDAENFAKTANVSRETLEKFMVYQELLSKWQKKINLIGPSTIYNLWERHFLDSAQLMQYIPQKLHSGQIYDVGTGAGFPGLVLSIMGVKNVNLIDSDTRKCTFLREVVRQTEVNANVINAHLPKDAQQNIYPEASVIFARALAPLPKLLDIVFPVISPTTCCILLKGEKFNEEILNARVSWKFELQTLDSQTSESGKIIILNEVCRNESEVE